MLTKEDKRNISIVRKNLRRMNRMFNEHLSKIPENIWPKTFTEKDERIAVYRNKDFLVQVFHVSDDLIRLSINVCDITSDGQWKENITWDQLQWIKHSVGYGDKDAVEVFPDNKDVVNVSNMRHLFVFTKQRLPFVWRNKSTQHAS